jgi:hypothetical protein
MIFAAIVWNHKLGSLILGMGRCSVREFGPSLMETQEFGIFALRPWCDTRIFALLYRAKYAFSNKISFL